MNNTYPIEGIIQEWLYENMEQVPILEVSKDLYEFIRNRAIIYSTYIKGTEIIETAYQFHNELFRMKIKENEQHRL